MAKTLGHEIIGHKGLRGDLQAAANIDRLFANAVLTEDRPDRNNDPNIVSIKRFSAPFYTDRGFAEARLTVKESIEHSHRIYSLELDEIKKPSSPDKGGLDEQANTPALDGCDKLIQKIKNASAKIKNRKKDNFRFSVSGDRTDFNGNERNGFVESIDRDGLPDPIITPKGGQQADFLLFRLQLLYHKLLKMQIISGFRSVGMELILTETNGLVRS